jgi:hypothetical protein
MNVKEISQRRRSLRQKAEVARQETLRLRMLMAAQQPRSGDKVRVEQLLRSWRWDGLKARMSNCRFSRYVGASSKHGVVIPVSMEREFERDDALGLGQEFLEALLAEGTLDGAAALARFCGVIQASAVYVPVARRAFTLWAAYELLTFEEALYVTPPGFRWPGVPILVRNNLPMLYPTVFWPRFAWDEGTARLIFVGCWWPDHCNGPFWSALCPREAVPMMQARFEPERYRRRPVRSDDRTRKEGDDSASYARIRAELLTAGASSAALDRVFPVATRT